MKHITVRAGLIALIVAMSAPTIHAMDKVDKKKEMDVIEDRAQNVTDRAERGRDKAEGHAGKKDKVSDRKYSETSDVPAYEGAPRRDGQRDGIDRDERITGLENAATRGNEKSQEMRARRDEGKAIKEEYKAGKESGSDAATLEEEAGDEAEKQGKKPWWKFWE